MQPAQFNFKYMVIGIAALIDGNGGVQVTMGMRKLNTTLGAIKGLYVIHHANHADELMLCHEVAPGKTKIFRVNSELGNSEFRRFVDTLAHYRPDADLRRYESSVAHQMMGATNVNKIVPIVMTLLFTAGIFIFALPWFIHGVDSGHADVEVAQLHEPDFSPESRNVTVKNGQFLIDAALQIEHTENGSVTSVEWAIPLVPPDWETGDPVHVVLKTHELSAAEAASIDPMGGVDGVMRTVLWEGLPSDELNYLKNNHGLNLADDVVEIEYQADTSMELYIGLFMVGFIFVLMTIISFVVARKQKKEQAASQARM